MVTSALWKWYKTFLPTQRIFKKIFKVIQQKELKPSMENMEMKYSVAVISFEGPVWMHTHLGNGWIFLALLYEQ